MVQKYIILLDSFGELMTLIHGLIETQIGSWLATHATECFWH